MAYFVKISGDEIIAVSRQQKTGYVALPAGVPGGAGALKYYRDSNSEWVARPVVSEPFPTGTTIDVFDALAGNQHIGSTINVMPVLPDAGTYVIEVSPPFPYLPREYRVDVA